MRFDIGTKTVIVAAGPTVVSRAIDLAGANAAYIEVNVLINDSNTLDIVPQQSNDLSNWKALGATEHNSAPGVLVFTRSGISSRYVRLAYSVQFAVGDPELIVSAIIDTKTL